MGLSEIKKKLFSKRVSSKVTAVSGVQAHTPGISETLVVHKSQIHLQPQKVLVSRTLLSEASNSENQPDRRDFSRIDVILNALPIIEELIGRCEDHNNDQAVRNGESYRKSPKFAYLGHASAAISLLEKHLTSIRETGQTSEFDDTVTQLATCLESMLVREPCLLRLEMKQWSSSLIVEIQSNFENASPCDLLRDLLGHSQTPSKTKAALLKAVQDNLNSQGNEDWKNFSQSLAAFTDQLQCAGHDFKEEKLEQNRATIVRRPLPGVAEFIGHTFSVMACNCSLHSIRELSLRLCTYQGSNTTAFPETVTVLAKDLRGSTRQWAEIQVHSSHGIR